VIVDAFKKLLTSLSLLQVREIKIPLFKEGEVACGFDPRHNRVLINTIIDFLSRPSAAIRTPGEAVSAIPS
jgi:hypothetical protein